MNLKINLKTKAKLKISMCVYITNIKEKEKVYKAEEEIFSTRVKFASVSLGYVEKNG